MTDGLQVVSSGLLVSDMSVNGGVSSGTSQVLAVSEGDVLTIGALVALRQPKINDIDGVFGLIRVTYEKVIRLYISVDYTLLVHSLNSLQHLSSDVAN